MSTRINLRNPLLPAVAVPDETPPPVPTAQKTTSNAPLASELPSLTTAASGPPTDEELDASTLPSPINLSRNSYLCASPASFFAKSFLANPSRNISTTTQTNLTSQSLPVELQSTKQVDLKNMYEVLGPKEVTLSRIQFAPQYLFSEVLDNEISKSWKNAFSVVNKKSVSRHENKISDHDI